MPEDSVEGDWVALSSENKDLTGEYISSSTEEGRDPRVPLRATINTQDNPLSRVPFQS